MAFKLQPIGQARHNVEKLVGTFGYVKGNARFNEQAKISRETTNERGIHSLWLELKNIMATNCSTMEH